MRREGDEASAAGGRRHSSAERDNRAERCQSEQAPPSVAPKHQLDDRTAIRIFRK
jgi:hypothetical protein